MIYVSSATMLWPTLTMADGDEVPAASGNKKKKKKKNSGKLGRSNLYGILLLVI